MENSANGDVMGSGERVLTEEDHEGIRRVCAWGAKCLRFLRGMELPPRLKVINVHLFQEEMRLVWKWLWDVPSSTGEFRGRLVGVERFLEGCYATGLMRPAWAVLTGDELRSIRAGSEGHALEWMRLDGLVLRAGEGGCAVRDKKVVGAPCTWSMLMGGSEKAIAKVWRRCSGLKMEDCAGWWQGIREAATPVVVGKVLMKGGMEEERGAKAVEVEGRMLGLSSGGFVRICTARMEVVAQYEAEDVNRWMTGSLGDVVPYGEDKSELWRKGSILSLLGLLRKKSVGLFLGGEAAGLFKSRELEVGRMDRVVDEEGIFNAYGSVSLVRNHSYIQSYMRDKRGLSLEGVAWEGVSPDVLVLELGFGPKYKGGSVTVLVEGLRSMCDLGALLRWVALLMSEESGRMAGRIWKALKAWEALEAEDRDVVMELISRGELRRW